MWVNQRFNNNSRNYNNDNFPNRNNFYSKRVERGNTFQPRAIRGGYNPRYYNNGVERNYKRNYNQNNGFQKQRHNTSRIISKCTGYRRRKNKYMHSYSVMCDKDHINNSIRGHNICDELYKESYNVCVTKLKNDNKISVNVAGYSVCALLDTGSTISTINLELYNKIKQTTKLGMNRYKKNNVT